MRLYNTLVAAARGAAASARADPDVLLRPDRLPAGAHRQRASVRARDVAARLAPRPRLRRDARPQHHRRQRQDLRRGAGRERRARRAARRSGISRTRATSASGCPTRCRRRRRRSRRSSRFIEKLVDAGHAYEASGDVYFSVATDPGYGRLSRQKVANMEPEEDSPLKRAPQDFALWKATKPGEDTSWDSPWGPGRPGWHIECSVMAEDAFGPVFEIHGGGLDLVFPHHENELAQSLALGHDFARIWMHNGLLTRRRREDVQVARQRHDDPRGHRRVGPRGRADAAALGPVAQAARLQPGDARAGRPHSSRRSATSSARRASRSGTGPSSRPRSTTTSTRRRRSR